MCGIALIAQQSLCAGDGEEIQRMTRSLSHRGPDDARFLFLPGCHMGHARLSIIDLGNGAQPMCSVDQRYWIVFNGEIYNYRELRHLLVQDGCQFQTNSDTEVILSSYAKWGESCLQRFRGMFAFAIWDVWEHSLFAARDLFGEKPLFYALLADGGIAIASELKALLASGLIGTNVDRVSVDAYLGFGYVPPDRTIYVNINTLPPGHSLFMFKGKLAQQCYWEPHFGTQEISLDVAAEQLNYLLHRAVKRQMVADVPIGAFLSGGLDSSTIVALMEGQSSGPVLTFAAGFGKQINELPYAKAVAERYGTEHYELDFGEPEVGVLLQMMAQIYDEPFADTSNIPTYLISKFARKHVKVVLSGDGGDELLGGYWWYPPLARSEISSRSWARWLLLRLLAQTGWSNAGEWSRQSVASGWATRYPDMWTRCMMAQQVFRPRERSSLWGRCGQLVRYDPSDTYKPPASTFGMNRCFHFDLTAYLPGDILVKVDRAAMANGLETRAPFLDRDVVEFALTLPSVLKVRDDETKVVLRRACERYWPEQLHRRGKQGFGAPADAWLQRTDVNHLLERVFSSGSPLRSLLPGINLNRRFRTCYQVWVLLVLGLWLERKATNL